MRRTFFTTAALLLFSYSRWLSCAFDTKHFSRMIFFLFVSLLICTSQISAQCLVKKLGHHYGFFRVTNFKEKICWLSEPFAYDKVNGHIPNYDQIKECFKRQVSALGGNVEFDADKFGKNDVVWLNNAYDPADGLNSSDNWYLPSISDCYKNIQEEIRYKTSSGIKVNIVGMYKRGLIDSNIITSEN